MKFAEHLSAHITPEWRKQYIQYEVMKAMLYKGSETAGNVSPGAAESQAVARYLANFDETFFHFCEKELTKINTFYSEKLAEANRKWSMLQTELNSAQLPVTDTRQSSFLPFGLINLEPQQPHTKISTRKLHDLKLAFSEYYLSLVLLQNYQNLNYTGFRKILKKYDKVIKNDAGCRWKSEHVDTAPFWLNKDIEKLIDKTENCFINDLESGDRQKAMKRLRVPPLCDQHSPWVTFKVGLFFGSFVVLLAAVALSAVLHKDSAAVTTAQNDWRIVLRLFRGPLLIVIFLFLIGVNVYGWRSSGVNHVLIFELDPRSHLSEQHIMEVAGALGVLWGVCALLFVFSSNLNFPAYVSPFLLVVCMFVFLVNPFKVMRYDARVWLLTVLTRVLLAPFFYVGFADFWIGDQLNSLASVFTDFHYWLCFYTNPNSTLQGKWEVASDADLCVKQNWLRPVVACLPAWFRFAQCLRRYRDTREGFPHLVNAGKYSTTFFVNLFASLNLAYPLLMPGEPVSGRNPFFYLWIVSLVVASGYTYAWDVRMDWGLMNCSWDYFLLRDERVYECKAFYYFAIVEDLLLRFAWIVLITLTQLGFDHTDSITTILAILEIFRRFVWNFIRLENEHLNNCGQFRAVRDISVAPIHMSSDEAEIIRMMDEQSVMMKWKKKSANSGSQRRILDSLGQQEEDSAISLLNF